MNKVLVTGAGGYIGRHVVQKLLDMGEHVIACDIRRDNIPAGAEVVEASIFGGEPDLYDRLGRPDLCIHMAWRDGFIHQSPKHMGDLSAHVRFCTDMMAAGLPALSVMGSMHEVGYWEGAIDADTPCKPLSQYGVAKNALRQSLMLSAPQYGCALHWLRAFYITGDDANSSSIFAKIAKAAQEGKRRFPFTTGKNLYDFIDVDELARMIALASMQTEHTGIMNVCTGRPMSLAERVEQFIRDNGWDIQLEYGAFPDRPYDSPGVWGDAAAIQAVIARAEAGGKAKPCA